MEVAPVPPLMRSPTLIAAFVFFALRVAAAPLPPKTRVYLTGDGQVVPRTTLVFLHGLSSRPGDPLIKRLVIQIRQQKQNYRVVAPWLRPVLKERQQIYRAGPHTMPDQLRRATQVINQIPGRVFLVGHSFGGSAAVELARLMPEKVKGVVGLGAAFHMLKSYWRQQPQPLRQLAQQVKTPTLLIHGTRDGVCPVGGALAFAQYNGGGKVCVKQLPGADHRFGADHPGPASDKTFAQIAQELVRFVRKND